MTNCGPVARGCITSFTVLRMTKISQLKGTKTVLAHPIFAVLLQAYHKVHCYLSIRRAFAVRESGVDTKRNHSSVKRNGHIAYTTRDRFAVLC